MSSETLYKLKIALGINIDYLLPGDISGSINKTFNELVKLSPQKAKYFEDLIHIFLQINKL
jgi:hypothetical protein